LTLVAVAMAGVVLAGASANAAVITGVTVEDFSSELTKHNRYAVNIINGSGLTGGAHGNTPDHTMWEITGTYDTPNDTLPAHVTLDLENNYVLGAIHVWNYNETNASLSTAGAKDVEIWVSPTDSTAGLVKLDNAGGDWVFAKALGAAGYLGFDVDLSGVTNDSLLNNVRLVRFNMLTNHGQIKDLTGLSEVQFDGVVVPEPATILAMMAASLPALLKRRRSRG